MAFNRLCDADSKLGVLRWLKTVSLPGLDFKKITHQQLLRSMDALVEHPQVLEEVLMGTVAPMIDSRLSVVFYNMTTVRTEGVSEEDGELRHYGMAKEGVIVRQFMLGLVQTQEGIPLYQEVFEGNTAEVAPERPPYKR
jgi:transposase